MQTAAKLAENKIVKRRLIEEGFTVVRVSHKGHGWLEIGIDIVKPGDCFCVDVPRNMGHCQKCQDAYFTTRTAIRQIAQDMTGRTGEYDGNTLIQIRLV